MFRRNAFAAFFALAFLGNAQVRPPYATAKVPVVTNGTPKMLADWMYKIMYIAYSDNLLPITEAGPGAPIKLLAPSTVNGQVVACINSFSPIAYVGTDASGRTTVQFVHPFEIQGSVQSLVIPNFIGGNSCKFSPDGTLYVSSGDSSSPNQLVAIDPKSLTITNSWTSTFPLGDIAATQYGVYATYTSGSTAGFGAVRGAQFKAVAPLQDPKYLTIVVNPLGYLYAGNRGFDPLGQPTKFGSDSYLGALYLRGYTDVAFPDPTSPWFAYGIAGGFIYGLNVFDGGTLQIGLTLPTSQHFRSVAAQRQADGNDIVVAFRDTAGTVEYYRATPPHLVYYAGHADSYMPDPVAPGAHLSIFGQGLSTKYGDQFTAGVEDARQLGDTQVFWDDVPIRLDYVSFSQINAHVPQNTTDGNHIVTVKVKGVPVGTMYTPPQVYTKVVDQWFAAFTYRDLKNPGVMDPILTLATPTGYPLIGNPALWSGFTLAGGGDVATIWGSGGGRTIVPIPDDLVSQGGQYLLVNAPEVWIGGVKATVLYAGRAPGFVSLDQVNFIVPTGLAAGPQDVVLVSLGGNKMTYPGGIWLK